MKTCTFFGHRDAPETIKPILKATIINLIENETVYDFYVGNQGDFDSMVLDILIELSDLYNIRYNVVLAYITGKKYDFERYKGVNTIFPHGIEKTPPRFAISYRNNWLIKQSDYVITYVTHSWGGAAEFKNIAEKKRKKVFELSTYSIDG
ncbi:MAG: hypothetical protein ACI4F7_04085 [Acutalibacteraceae bacterium]